MCLLVFKPVLFIWNISWNISDPNCNYETILELFPIRWFSLNSYNHICKVKKKPDFINLVDCWHFRMVFWGIICWKGGCGSFLVKVLTRKNPRPVYRPLPSFQLCFVNTLIKHKVREPSHQKYIWIYKKAQSNTCQTWGNRWKKLFPVITVGH